MYTPFDRSGMGRVSWEPLSELLSIFSNTTLPPNEIILKEVCTVWLRLSGYFKVISFVAGFG